MPEQGLYDYGGLSLNGDQGQEVGGLFGVIGRGINNISGTTANNQFAASEAAKERAFQDYMSSTAYQRAVRDMKAAGINPATLTGLNGSSGAASTPSGASASASGSGGALPAVIGALVKIAIAAAA